MEFMIHEQLTESNETSWWNPDEEDEEESSPAKRLKNSLLRKLSVNSKKDNTSTTASNSRDLKTSKLADSNNITSSGGTSAADLASIIEAPAPKLSISFKEKSAMLVGDDVSSVEVDLTITDHIFLFEMAPVSYKVPKSPLENLTLSPLLVVQLSAEDASYNVTNTAPCQSKLETDIDILLSELDEELRKMQSPEFSQHKKTIKRQKSRPNTRPDEVLDSYVGEQVNLKSVKQTVGKDLEQSQALIEINQILGSIEALKFDIDLNPPTRDTKPAEVVYPSPAATPGPTMLTPNSEFNFNMKLNMVEPTAPADPVHDSIKPASVRRSFDSRPLPKIPIQVDSNPQDRSSSTGPLLTVTNKNEVPKFHTRPDADAAGSSLLMTKIESTDSARLTSSTGGTSQMDNSESSTPMEPLNNAKPRKKLSQIFKMIVSKM